MTGMADPVERPQATNFSETLNPQQWAAVTHGDGPLLVVAGAGTGKTRVITHRIRYLLETQSALAGENILALTFTNKAADEMKARVVREAGERGKGVWLGTFHKFCLERILREENVELREIDDAEHWILLRHNMRTLDLHVFRHLAEPGQFLSDFVKFFSRCQDELVTPEKYETHVAGLCAEFARESAALDAETRAAREEELREQQEVARAYRTSDRLLRERNLCTFGMQLLDSVRRLQSDEALLQRLREQYHYILVDEFQDTNYAQIELLRLLAGERNNIFAVGDDDQAIYRFRGASFASFQLFAEKFIGRKIEPADPPAEVRVLNRNYRSTQRILRVAGHAISMNRDRMFPEKELATDHPPGEPVRVAEFVHKDDEARWVAAELARRHAEGRKWREFAVLYRAHAHRDALVKELTRRGIPYIIRNISIFTHPLVRDVVAWLRWIVFPGDDVAGARVLACAAWGLDAAGLVRLCERTRRGRGVALWDVLQSAQGELPFAANSARLAELVGLMNSLRARARKLSAAALLDELLAEIGLVLVQGDPARRYLDAFRGFVKDFEQSAVAGSRTVAEFLEFMNYFEEAGGRSDFSEDPAEDAVQLTTVHGAKGLEFGHVFLLRLVNRQFPAAKREAVLEFPTELMNEELPEGDSQIQEERRLFYVALTRARRRLTLTTVVNKRSKPSPFLDDVLLHDARFRDVLRLAPQVRTPDEPEPGRPATAASPRQLFGPHTPGARAYSDIAGWAASYRPPMSRPLQLSASAIETYLTCPQKYLFASAWGVRTGPHAARTFGAVMHTAVKFIVYELAHRRALPFEEVEACYEREWFSAGFEDDYQEQEYKQEGLEQLRAFHSACTAARAEMLEQEKYFELRLEDDVLLTGRMDQVNRLAGSNVEIVDYKTGRPLDASAARKSRQLSIYALAAREELDLEPARLTIYNLTSNEAVTTTREAKALENARSEIAEVAAGIRGGEFTARPGFPCKSCDFRLICPAHELAGATASDDS